MPTEVNGKTKQTGGCACGAIRYGFYEPLLGQMACHCRACQYHSGGGPAYLVVVNREEFRVTRGRPKEFTTLSESGRHVTRAFCGDCGSPLYSWIDDDETFCAVKVGSLDEPERYRPRAHIWMSEAQPWHKRGLLTARFRRNPPMKLAGKKPSGSKGA